MDWLWIVIGGILMITGIAGCLLPVLPGPPMSFLGLLVLQLQTPPSFSTKFLLFWAGIVIVVTVLDYIVPIIGTRRYGGTKFGIWGCGIGLIVGLWFGAPGIILGPFLGALIGEWIGHRNGDQALRAALGSFFGFLFGTLIKLIVSLTMLYYFVVSLV